MKIDTYACDVCGAQKKDTNHWWLLAVAPDNLATWQSSLQLIGWNTTTIERMSANNRDVSHLCSEACAVKKVSEFMGAKP